MTTSTTTRIDESTWHILQSIAAATTTTPYCRVATTSSTNDSVWNEECVYTFHTPFTNGTQGIVVHLYTFAGTIPELAFAGSVGRNGNNSNNSKDDIPQEQQQEGLFVCIVKQKVLKNNINKNKTTTTTTGEEDGVDHDHSKETSAPPPVLPTKLGIGIEGGFQTEEDKYEIISTYSIVHLRQQQQEQQQKESSLSFSTLSNVQIVSEIPFSTNLLQQQEKQDDNDDNDNNNDDHDSSIGLVTVQTNSSTITTPTTMTIPFLLIQSIRSIVYHSSATLQQDVKAWQMDHHEGQEDLPISKYAATLPFVDNGIMISPNPKTWFCQQHPEQMKNDDNKDHQNNLWLNLSDGFIGGGRRHWDGSGGTNGALEHYEETGRKYPLVVKLGTISSNLISTADCYSYAADEDGPVQIPNLAQLLQQRGIDCTIHEKQCYLRRNWKYNSMPLIIFLPVKQLKKQEILPKRRN